MDGFSGMLKWMWHFVYILRNQQRAQYIGSTHNLKNRLQQHNAGSVAATKNGIPWQIEWFCAFRHKQNALIFEKYLKSGSGTMVRYRHIASKE